MEAQVNYEGGAAAEGLPAVAAPVGLLARVHALVLEEGGALREGLGARPALVGLLPGVHPQVLHQPSSH